MLVWLQHEALGMGGQISPEYLCSHDEETSASMRLLFRKPVLSSTPQNRRSAFLPPKADQRWSLGLAWGLCMSWIWEPSLGRETGMCAGVGHGLGLLQLCRLQIFMLLLQGGVAWALGGCRQPHKTSRVANGATSGDLESVAGMQKWDTNCLKRCLSQLCPATMPRAQPCTGCAGFVHAPEFPQVWSPAGDQPPGLSLLCRSLPRCHLCQWCSLTPFLSLTCTFL